MYFVSPKKQMFMNEWLCDYYRKIISLLPDQESLRPFPQMFSTFIKVVLGR